MPASTPLLCLLLALAAPAMAADDPGPGEVRIPISRYEELLAARPEAAGRWALAAGRASVAVELQGDRPLARVSVDTTLSTDGPTLVPLLPGGVSITQARADNAPIALAPGAGGLLMRVDGAQEQAVQVEYVVDAVRTAGGWSLPIPLPPVPSTTLTAQLPPGVEPSVIPAAGLRVSRDRSGTQVRAEVPAGAGVQIAWADAGEQAATLSRAAYVGTRVGDAVAWTATFGVDGRADALPLLPADVALVELQVAGAPAPIRVVDGWFVTPVGGGGEVVARFETPLVADGPPAVALRLPRVPVSRFELTLPGDQAVTVEPAAAVRRSRKGSTTRASFHVAMTDAVTIRWTEALPEAQAEELRANAGLYHAVQADEGVLYLRTFVAMEVTRGAAKQLELDLPDGLLINRVSSEDGAVADWRVIEGKQRRLQVFLDRQVTEDFVYEVAGEVPLARGDDPELAIPIPRARGVGRQRGMVALLADKDLTLRPTKEEGVNPVGENQLPAFVRQALDDTIAHTFKLTGDDAALVAQVTEPERQDGRYDAQVDTLISLGEVTLDGSASVEIDVKSGSLDTLRLALPPGVNFGGLSAPSLREHKLVENGGRAFVDVTFTQPLDGRFRLDVRYERILEGGDGELTVPALAVVGAEVEQGRVAVEALAAVEVSASTVTNLSGVDVSELPRQLVLKTTNPILLAYKYVQADPPWALGLTVTRHRELDVQAATIDQAAYRTLVTRDGLAVTTARFVVRNRREQFLRVALPPNSTIWAASVAGEASKPALAEGSSEARPEVLVKIINSEDGFPVELVYATPASALGPFGRVRAVLPRPDLVVTDTVLDVFLPDGLRYGRARGNMDVEEAAVAADLSGLALGEASGALPLKLAVPTSGIRYRFRKLYANEGGREAAVGIPYLSRWGSRTAALGTAAGAAGLWIALGLLAWPRTRSNWRRWAAVLAASAGLLAAGVAWLDVGAGAPLVASLGVLVVGAGGAWWQRRRDADGEAEADAADEVDLQPASEAPEAPIE